MNWARSADGMTYVPKHRDDVQVDRCSGPENGCAGCLGGPFGYTPRHSAVTP